MTETITGHVITERDRVQRRVDARCRDCGATMAGSSRCYRCGSDQLDYRLHSETPMGEVFWCGATTRSPSPRERASGAI